MTESEMLALIPDIGKPNKPAGWWTKSELAKLKGSTSSAMRQWLEHQVEVGAWERNTFIVHVGNRHSPVACYRPTPTKTTSKQSSIGSSSSSVNRGTRRSSSR